MDSSRRELQNPIGEIEIGDIFDFWCFLASLMVLEASLMVSDSPWWSRDRSHIDPWSADLQGLNDAGLMPEWYWIDVWMILIEWRPWWSLMIPRSILYVGLMPERNRFRFSCFFVDSGSVPDSPWWTGGFGGSPPQRDGRPTVGRPERLVYIYIYTNITIYIHMQICE